MDGKKKSTKGTGSPAREYSCLLNVGALVWAKLEGHPWWPSIVCKHPTSGLHYKKKEDEAGVIHVHFYGDPPRRYWIKEKCVKPFASRRESFVKLKKAFEDADDASKRSVSDRLNDVCNAQYRVGDNVRSEESDENDDVATPQKRKAKFPESTQKRIRVIILSDSDDDFKPKSGDDADWDSDAEESSFIAEELDSDAETPKKKRIRKDVKRSKSVSSTEASFSTQDSGDSEGKIWTHSTLDFLKKGQMRDCDGRLESHRLYDPKTLLVPVQFRTGLSPVMGQWWDLKAKHFDAVLFFKVGKLYELYHMDAVIGVKELNLVYMKCDFAHCCFPEIAYGQHSASLIEKGYRVARVEQTENPAKKNKKAQVTKFDKVVRREICQITTRGTRRYGFLDAQTNESNPAYLLAVTERRRKKKSQFGVCFIDTSIGKFRLGQFFDDIHLSRLRTLIAHVAPVQVLYERSSMSTKSMHILTNCLSNVMVDPLFPKTQFWGSEKTLKNLAEGGYFNLEDNPKNALVWPTVLGRMLSKSDCRGLTAKSEFKLAVSSLGAITWYLSDCLLDHELLTMKSFELYRPVDNLFKPHRKRPFSVIFGQRRNMVLDGITLKNLGILQNSAGTLEGTLLGRLDYCSTSAGRRLLRQWICTPLCDPSSIEERLEAITDLLEHPEITKECDTLLKTVPDMERLLSKIHTLGSALRCRKHPDSRAVFYQDRVYTKRKMLDLLSVLSGFKTAAEIVALFERSSLKSKLLRRVMTLEGGGRMFRDLKKLLIYFDGAFDYQQAQKDGEIIPSRGVHSDYDKAAFTIRNTNHGLNAYLEKQSRVLGCEVSYVGTARNRFQIEVPESAVKRIPDNYELQGQRQEFKKYWTSETKEFLSKMMSAEDLRDAALRDIMRRMSATLAKDYQKWDRVVQCLATLDVLLSLARYSQCGSKTMCRPTIVLPSYSMQPFIEILNGVHPCISTAFGGGDFIPNDTTVGVSENGTNASLVLVTGPNMSGKSTLMRQGCYVPAETCRLTPVDGVFTRLGACDLMMHGDERSDTNSTLWRASPYSLVLMDDLRKVTSTYADVAFAQSVVNELAHSIQCRAFFSTCDHSLVGKFSADNSCKLGHMACLFKNENEGYPRQETITLYKFIPGGCPKNCGFNASILSDIPIDVE